MAADLAPLPGVMYPAGTMSYADIYPTHVAIGGVTTQDRSLPSFGEQLTRVSGKALNLGAAEDSLISTPAGWLVLAVAALGALAWVRR